MSANDKVIIKELIDGSFVMNDIDIESDGRHGIYIGKAKTLKEAIKKVEEYMAENTVEYGYEVIYQDSYEERK